MFITDGDAGKVEQILETPGLADALESERFKQFFDHVPIAILVSELQPSEIISYANLEFERLTGYAIDSVLASLIGLPGRRPDIVMRFGHGPELPFSMRRPVGDVSMSLV